MLAGGGAINYYYHWVFDAMPKLSLLREAKLLESMNYFLVPNYLYSYQKQYLEYFGIPASKIINGELVKHIKADKLYVASTVRIHDHHPKWSLDFLFTSLFPHRGRKQRSKRIYIARGDASVNRKVINESELITRLKKYDFEIHHLSGMSIIEQARLFNAANVVVGAHGAGLSNLVFCQPGQKHWNSTPTNMYDISFMMFAIKGGSSMIISYVHLNPPLPIVLMTKDQPHSGCRCN